LPDRSKALRLGLDLLPDGDPMNTARALMPDPAELPTVGERIDVFDGMSTIAGGWGTRLSWVRTRAADFRREFAASGTPVSVKTCDLVSLPYPTRFGLFRAALTPAPFLSITNRMLVVRWTESNGTRRTLLFEPSDYELGVNTPYFADLSKKLPPAVQALAVVRHGTIQEHLQGLGIRPDEVDYLVFDHLHTQDLRRLVGTTRPQADISPNEPVRAMFPNARVIVQRGELEAMAELHPLQRPWYQPSTFADIAPDRFLVVDGGVLLGPGVALQATPGHVQGNQSLVLNTDTGIWASSENAVAAECLTPEHSRIPGVARYARQWGMEAVLNANTIETTAEQYNSLILEKSIVDVAQADSRFIQFFPSSELTAHWTNPGTAPTFVHRRIDHG